MVLFRAVQSEECIYIYIYIIVSVIFEVVELDLSGVVPCCSGPKRPHDRVAVTDMKSDFKTCLSNKTGFKVS